MLGIDRLLLIKILGMDQQGIVGKYESLEALPAISDGRYELLVVSAFDEGGQEVVTA